MSNSENKQSQNSKAGDFVDMVMRGDNVKAKEQLERILKEKTARRIKDTLAS